MSRPRESRRMLFLAGVLLAGLTLAAYFPALRCGFIWDDDALLTRNPLIKAADGLRRFWFTSAAADYWPVSSTTFWLEWRVWGMQAAGYHMTNVLLHVSESLLLWAVLRRMRIPGAFLAAALFAVHPVNAESVAWIAQRKNLMAMLFFLASVWWFLQADASAPTPIRRSSQSEGGRSTSGLPTNLYYSLSLAAFILALLSKGSVTPLPVILLGIVAWRRRPSARDLAWLAPFFIAAGAFASIDLWFQNHGGAEAIRQTGALERMLGAAAVICFYLSKALWPAHLAFIYPDWTIHGGEWLWWCPTLGVAALTAGLWRYRRCGTRPALFAWGYFCAMLVPVLGLTDIYFMKYSLVADHYQHLAIIGVVSWVGCLFAGCWAQARPIARIGLGGAAGAAVLALALLTWRQCRLYQDDRTLFTATLVQNPRCWMADNYLGIGFAQQGRMGEAIRDYDEALRVKPDYPEAHNNLGMAFKALGRTPEAIAEFRVAILQFGNAPGLDLDSARAHANLANALATLPGHLPEALAHYEAALRIRPDYAEAHANLANALARIPGRRSEAVMHYAAALRLEPDNAGVHYDLANVLATDPRRLSEALAHYGEALRISPDFAEAHDNRANVLARIPGRLAEALGDYQAALRTEPNNAEAHYNLANALATLPSRLPEALAHYEAALRIKPDFAEAENNLALVYARIGRFDEATVHLELALKINPAYTPARDYLNRLRATQIR